MDTVTIGGDGGGEYLSAVTRRSDWTAGPLGAGDVVPEGGAEVEEMEGGGDESMEDTEPPLFDQALGCGMMPPPCC